MGNKMDKQYLDSTGLQTLWNKIKNNFVRNNGTGASGTWGINISGIAANAANARTLANYDLSNICFYQTKRDFINGTLITTSIDYSNTSGAAFYGEIKGNSYGAPQCIYTQFQGYIYNGTIINYCVSHISGYPITPITAMNVGGYLCFWFPRLRYWQGFNIFVSDVRAPGKAKNLVTNVTDVEKPDGTKQVVLTDNTSVTYTSSNLTSSVVARLGTLSNSTTGNAATATDYAASGGIATALAGKAASDHTHTTTITADTGTNQITLAANTKYKLTSGGSTFVFTTPTDTNTTYSASTGLTLTGTAFSVKYGTAAGTACQGNDSRLSDSRNAKDVYSWAKASSKPSYSFSEISSRGEAYLDWGGKNFSNSYSPIDAAMVGRLSANRTAFVPASKVTIEYSRDGGSTWTDYGASNGLKTGFFTNFNSGINIGNCSTSYPSTSNYQVRVTLNTSDSVYSILNKFIICVSTNGSNSNWCTIDARLQSNIESGTNTWTVFANRVTVSGWTGYNVINTSGITTYGNTKGSQYGQVRFTFGCGSGGTTTYPGLIIHGVNCYGGVGWQTPSTLAKTGVLYTFDMSQNVTFPAKVTAASFIGNATTATKADKVLGSYTANGGQQNPDYFGKNNVGFLMMNTQVNGNSQYKDWMIMDCYSGPDAGGGVAFGVNRQQLGAYIMRSAAARTSWAESAELYGTHNANKTSIAWSASSLTLNGPISGATTGSFSGDVTTASLTAAGTLQARYVNTHPENNGTIIPFIFNDLAFLLTRGGTVSTYTTTSTTFTSLTLSGTSSVPTSNVANAFDGSADFMTIGNSEAISGIQGKTIVVDVSFGSNRLYHGNTAYIDFGNSTWAPDASGETVKIFKLRDGDSAYSEGADYVNDGKTEHRIAQVEASSNGLKALRFVFKTSSTRAYIIRISEIGAISYNSQMLRTPFMSRGVDDPVWRNITPAASTYNLGSSSNRWGTLYSGTLDANSVVVNGATSDPCNIISVKNANNSITNIQSSDVAIRHALSFKWWNTDWQIGNVRGGASDSLGFGITKNNSNCVFRVNENNGFINEHIAYHAGNSNKSDVNWTCQDLIAHRGVSAKGIVDLNLANITWGAWQSTSVNTVQCRTLGNMVVLKGEILNCMCTNSTSGTSVLILPEGCHPSDGRRMYRSVVLTKTADTTKILGVAELTFSTAGAITCKYFSTDSPGTAIAAKATLDLNGIIIFTD